MPQYLVVLDLETTGLNADTDHIIEIAATKIDRETGEEIGQFNHLIKPSIEVDEKTTFITGITNEMLVDAQPFSVYLEDLKEFVKDSCIAGHNISFDTGFLSKHDMVFSTYPEFDTCPWAQVLGKNLPSYSLEVIARTLGIEHSASHRAYSDVEANLQLYFWLNKQFCALPEEQKKQIEEWAFACGYVLPFSHQCDLFAGSNDSNEKIETVMPLSDTAEKELEIDILSGKQYSSVSEDVLLKSIANQYQSAQKRLLYVAPNWTAYDFFQDKESVCILRSPYSYINQKKLSIFLSDPSIWSEMEFFIALKIYMYIGIDDLDTQLLDVSSLPVFREEKRILKPLCCSGFSEKSPSMDILRKQLSQAKCIFTDAHTFAHHSIEGDFQIFLADFEGSFLQKTYQDECDQVGLKQLQDIWKEITTHPLVGEDPRFVSIDERLSFLSGMVQHYILAGK
ncbi:MAG: 3'-5' exonuclease [Patescibacteria group bacterium]|nr:3'-5' exonuclease [Patescibacteria group bacterium]